MLQMLGPEYLRWAPSWSVVMWDTNASTSSTSSETINSSRVWRFMDSGARLRVQHFQLHTRKSEPKSDEQGCWPGSNPKP